jgi:hypothetical protein
MSTKEIFLFQESERQKQKEKEKYKIQLISFVHSFTIPLTHAVTLNVNHNKLFNFFRKNTNIAPASNSRPIYDICIKGLRTFSFDLANSLYGNSWKRYPKHFVWIPVSEGFRPGKKIHFHCALGVDQSRFEGLEERILKLWTKTPFGSDNVRVETYRDENWLNYSFKEADPDFRLDIVQDCILRSPANNYNC